MSDTANELSRPNLWCEVAKGTLTLATVMPDGIVRRVDMKCEFPGNPDDVNQWQAALNENLAIMAANLFGEQLHDAFERRHADLLAALRGAVA